MVLRFKNHILFEINSATSTENYSSTGKTKHSKPDANQTSNQELGAPAPVPDACSLDDPDCEACQ